MIHVGQPSLTEPHRRFASPFAGCGHRLPRPGVKVKQILEERRDDDRSIHQRAQTLKRSTWSPVRKSTLQLRCSPVCFLLLFCVRESCFRPRSRCGGARRPACCMLRYRFHDGRSELDTPQKYLCFADSFEVEGPEVNRLVGGSTKIDRLPAAGGAFTLVHHRSTQLRAGHQDLSTSRPPASRFSVCQPPESSPHIAPKPPLGGEMRAVLPVKPATSPADGSVLGTSSNDSETASYPRLLVRVRRRIVGATQRLSPSPSRLSQGYQADNVQLLPRQRTPAQGIR